MIFYIIYTIIVIMNIAAIILLDFWIPNALALLLIIGVIITNVRRDLRIKRFLKEMDDRLRKVKDE